MILSLQSLRFVFCALIFACHYFRNVGGSDFEYGGDAGVAFFFMLSGFVLSCGYGSRVCASGVSLVDFMRKRIVKLYPLHLLTFSVALLMGSVEGVKFSAVKTVLHVLMLQEFTLSADMMNYGTGLSWFLGALLFCYALFPVLYRAVVVCRGWRVGAVAAIYLILYITVVAHCNNSAIDGYVFAFPPFRVIDFTVGIMVFRAYSSPMSAVVKRRIGVWSPKLLTVCDVLVAGLCLSTYAVYPYLPSWLRFSMLFWVPFAVLVYWAAVSDGGRGCMARVLRWRAFEALGGISFEIYMIHGIVITLCVFVWGRLVGYDTLPDSVHFVLSLAVSAAVAKLYSVSAIKLRSLHSAKRPTSGHNM